MKTYILLKDLPNVKAGTEFEANRLGCDGNYYSCIGSRADIVKFAAYDVENMPDWFKPKEEKIWTDSDLKDFGYIVGQCTEEQISKELTHFKTLKEKADKQ